MLKNRIQIFEEAVIRTEHRLEILGEFLSSVGKSHISELTPREMLAAQQKMHPTLGESAASDSESNPAPKRVI